MLLKLDSFLDSGSILDDFSNFPLNLTTLTVLAAEARGHNCNNVFNNNVAFSSSYQRSSAMTFATVNTHSWHPITISV